MARYELVLVARSPQPVGPPVLTEVDRIAPLSMTWTDELSEPQALEVTCSVAGLTEQVKERLREPDYLPSELWLRRDGRQVFAGPLMPGWRRAGDRVTLNARGLLFYLRLWTIAQDLTYTNADQFAIVKGLVDYWQGQEHGHVGIDTSRIGTSGTLRTITYKRTEQHRIAARVEDLGRRDGGFDIDVDPASRVLGLWSPTKGTDRSSGPDALIFDRRTVTSEQVTVSVGPDDLASEGYGTGASAGTGDPLFATATPNLALRTRYGRTAVTGTFSEVSEQAVLDAHTQALLDARGRAYLVPGPDVRITAETDLSLYEVGDTVFYDLDADLGVSGAFRLRRRQVRVVGQRERASLEFV